jgi:hypothetical protein
MSGRVTRKAAVAGILPRTTYVFKLDDPACGTARESMLENGCTGRMARILRIVNTSPLRQRFPLVAPTPRHKLPHSDAGRPRSPLPQGKAAGSLKSNRCPPVVCFLLDSRSTYKEGSSMDPSRSALALHPLAPWSQPASYLPFTWRVYGYRRGK